jgi:hypothetical protein
MVAVSSISPEEIFSYQSRQNNANQNLLSTKANTQYQRALQGIQYGQQVGDYERTANRARVQLPTQYLKAGTFNSGLYRNALSNYAVDRLNGMRNMANNYQLGQLNSVFTDRAAEDNYANTTAQIAAEKYARQAALASMLRENM